MGDFEVDNPFLFILLKKIIHNEFNIINFNIIY